MNDTMCKIPVEARIEIINGEPVMASARYEEIPAELIAKYFAEHSGAMILKGGEKNDTK